MADRTAQLQTRETISSDIPKNESTSPAPPPPVTSRGWGSRQPSVPQQNPIEALAALRLDLTTAQQYRGDLQTRLETSLKELAALKSRSKSDSKRISQLSTEVSQLTVRVRDRDEELKGKRKLLEDMQDEVATLNLQLNVADEKSDKLRKENQDLVDRWMESKRQEADKMNEGSKYS
ncbi:MAG: hypothetical protein Q9227_008431 [Pyrenula ochraceoflavens]